MLDQVFDPYSSTKQKGAQKGMGLGLTIVHAIVKKHGGLVWIDSKPGQGCTVYLYLPAGNWTDRISGDVESAEGPRRVLVMDDDEMMRMINKKMFEHFKCNVKLAEDGETAVRLFQQAVDEGKRFDLVLLDLRVKKGMNGVDAGREIMIIDPQARLIAVSGDAGSDVMLNYQEHNFIDAQAKPFSVDVVQDLIHRFL